MRITQFSVVVTVVALALQAAPIKAVSLGFVKEGMDPDGLVTYYCTLTGEGIYGWVIDVEVQGGDIIQADAIGIDFDPTSFYWYDVGTQFPRMYSSAAMDLNGCANFPPGTYKVARFLVRPHCKFNDGNVSISYSSSSEAILYTGECCNPGFPGTCTRYQYLAYTDYRCDSTDLHCLQATVDNITDQWTSEELQANYLCCQPATSPQSVSLGFVKDSVDPDGVANYYCIMTGDGIHSWSFRVGVQGGTVIHTDTLGIDVDANKLYYYSTHTDWPNNGFSCDAVTDIYGCDNLPAGSYKVARFSVRPDCAGNGDMTLYYYDDYVVGIITGECCAQNLSSYRATKTCPAFDESCVPANAEIFTEHLDPEVLQRACAPNGHLTLDPSIICPGTPVTINGSDFAPNMVYNVSNDWYSVTVRTDHNGNFQQRVTCDETEEFSAGNITFSASPLTGGLSVKATLSVSEDNSFDLAFNATWSHGCSVTRDDELVNLISQGCAEWGNMLLANDYIVPHPLRSYGCTISSVVMVFQMYGINRIKLIETDYWPGYFPDANRLCAKAKDANGDMVVVDTLNLETIVLQNNIHEYHVDLTPATLNEWASAPLSKVPYEQRTPDAHNDILGWPFVTEVANYETWRQVPQGTKLRGFVGELGDTSDHSRNVDFAYIALAVDEQVVFAPFTNTTLRHDSCNLKRALAESRPVILSVPGRSGPCGHSIVATGIDCFWGSIVVKDPGKDQVTVDEWCDDAVKAPQRESFPLPGVRRPRITFYALSPVELAVIDPSGLSTDVYRNEIPNSYFDYQGPIESDDADDQESIGGYKAISIDDPIEGEYRIQLVGSGDGDFILQTKVTSGDGRVYSDSLRGVVVENQALAYKVSYMLGNENEISIAEMRPPVANAGMDQVANEGDAVVLDGSGSSDPNQEALDYHWMQLAGPSIDLDLTNPVNPQFVAPSVGRDGATLTLQLIVRNAYIQSAPSIVNVTIKQVNKCPIVDVESAAAVNELSLGVPLIGSNSYDPDNEAMLFIWSQMDGPNAIIDNPTSADTTFQAPSVGRGGAILTFQLRVDDGWCQSAALVSVSVENVIHCPRANAGDDVTVAEGIVVMLDGNRSVDPDSDALTYWWHQISGPTVNLSDSTIVNPTFTAPRVDAGGETLLFGLVVSDGLCESDLAEVAVTVKNSDAPPLCEIARANPVILWPPTHKLMTVEIAGISDPDNDPVMIHIIGVTQDEPMVGLGDGDTSPDAVITEGKLLLRAERSGTGNGRVYVVTFEATDNGGESCVGKVRVTVPHDRKDTSTPDDGQKYKSIGELDD
jgi:hypothetical protein